MENLQALFSDLQRRADELGVSFKPPLSDEALRSWSAQARGVLKFELPASYVELLALSSGLETQRGWLYDAESFLQQNYVRWFCDTVARNGPNGFEIEYVPLKEPLKPDYAWLGAYGNMDQYIFDFASREYRSTGLGSPDYVWFSSPALSELIRYMVSPEAEQHTADDRE